MEGAEEAAGTGDVVTEGLERDPTMTTAAERNRQHCDYMRAARRKEGGRKGRRNAENEGGMPWWG